MLTIVTRESQFVWLKVHHHIWLHVDYYIRSFQPFGGASCHHLQRITLKLVAAR
jgi:hypothetical protein